MRKETYSAVIFSLVIHGLILFVLLITQSTEQKAIKPAKQNTAIKSFIYYAPNLAMVEQSTIEATPLTTIIKAPASKKKEQTKHQAKVEVKPENKPRVILPPLDQNAIDVSKVIKSPKNSIKTSQPKPLPIPTDRKLDSFTQLQRLRSKLNQRAAAKIDSPYQRYQAPSIFNSDIKSVPHSVPLKDEEQEREKNTKNIGAGIAITKGDDGRCSVTQDMSAYGLSEGSSTQYFSCGETKFNSSFREHMKKVKNKLGKN